MVTDALVFLRLWDVKMKKLTEKEKFEAGKAQMYQYLDSQYLAWHIVAVESIKKLILNLDDFYSDITGENQPLSIVEHEQIKNEVRIGWIFEALSHAEQAIEDLFSFLMLSKNIDTFVKNVVMLQMLSDIFGILRQMIHQNFWESFFFHILIWMIV